MESYATEFLEHLSPLVIVQGLGSSIGEFDARTDQNVESGEELFRKQPQLKESPAVKGLVSSWKKYHNNDLIWDSSAIKTESGAAPAKYHFKFVDGHKIPKVKELNESVEASSFPTVPLGIEWIQKYKFTLPSIVVSFYELNGEYTEQTEIEKVDLELISEINFLKEQLNKRNVKQLVILVSSSSSIVAHGISERLNNIRRQTGLNNRNCLLFLESSTPKETNELLIASLQVMKASEIDFYTNLEKKIRRKRSKALGYATDDFSKNVLETRYALKSAIISEFKQQYDYAIKGFQASYESLLECFDTLSPKDEHWIQYRVLSDVIIFHIVRLNLYQGQTNLAYRKADIHLQSTIYILKRKNISISSSSVCNWLSHQFKWLAQLSDLAPASLVPTSIAFKPEEKDPHSPLVLPQSGFLYLQSIGLQRRRSAAIEAPNSVVDPYFNDTTEDTKAPLINLLNFSKLAFQKKDNFFTRSVSYVNYQIAEEHFSNEDFELAAKFYESSLESIKEDEWGSLSGTIYYKLFLCSIELNKHYASVVNLLELSLIEYGQLSQTIVEGMKSLIQNENEYSKFLRDNPEKLSINVSTDESYDIFQSEVLFKQEVVSLSHSSQFQVKIKSNLNELFDTVKLKEITITFQGSIQPIVLKHDDSISSKRVLEVKDLSLNEGGSTFSGSTNLQFSPEEEKVFIFEIPARKIGTNTCVSITSTLDYKDLLEIQLNVPITNSKFKTLHRWIDPKRGEKIVSNKNPESCEIVPRVPNTKLSFSNKETYCIVGEKFPLKLNISNSDHESVDIKLSAEALLGEETIASKWSQSENDGGVLELKSLEVNKDIEQVLSLDVPNYFDKTASSIIVKITYTFFVSGDYDVPITDIITTKIPIIDPFKISISFFPRLKKNDIKSVFVMSEKDNALPKPSRYWLTKIAVVNNLDAEIELLEEKTYFDSNNEDTRCEEVAEKYESFKEGNKWVSYHFIETAIDNGQQYRNINFDSCLVLKYKRKGSDAVQVFQNKPWKFTLPLLDPRVLLDVVPQEDSKDLKLIFMIENPTTRLFSFSLTLADNQNFQTTGIKVQNISVLPCTRQNIEYHAVPLSSGLLKAPQLTVYDLNYRVNLPTLLVTDNAQLRNREIFIDVEE